MGKKQGKKYLSIYIYMCVCVWWRQIAFLGKKNVGAKKNLMTAPLTP